MEKMYGIGSLVQADYQGEEICYPHPENPGRKTWSFVRFIPKSQCGKAELKQAQQEGKSLPSGLIPGDCVAVFVPSSQVAGKGFINGRDGETYTCLRHQLGVGESSTVVKKVGLLKKESSTVYELEINQVFLYLEGQIVYEWYTKEPIGRYHPGGLGVEPYFQCDVLSTSVEDFVGAEEFFGEMAPYQAYQQEIKEKMSQFLVEEWRNRAAAQKKLRGDKVEE